MKYIKYLTQSITTGRYLSTTLGHPIYFKHSRYQHILYGNITRNSTLYDCIEHCSSLNPDADLSTELLVLVDGRTASASEILVAALRDNQRATTMGSTTVGKDVAQVRYFRYYDNL